MLIHDNIKYLRKLKRLSQKDFAQRLGLNRGNIASYELSTMPPLDAVLKIAKWYNISTDALLEANLRESLTMDAQSLDEAEASLATIAVQLKKMIEFTEKSETEFAAGIGLSEKRLQAILNGKEFVRVEEVVSIANAYPWVSLEWLIRDTGSMVGSTQARLNKVAEPLAAKYFTKGSVSIELFMEQVLERLDRLEQNNSREE